MVLKCTLDNKLSFTISNLTENKRNSNRQILLSDWDAQRYIRFYFRIFTQKLRHILWVPVGSTPSTERFYVCLFGFNVAFNIICHITTVSGCDRELNAHFYSAASLWYQIPDTFT